MSWVSEVGADSPVGWWRLGESSGATAADISGNSLDATYNDSAGTNFTTLALNQPSLIEGDADTAFKAQILSGTQRWFVQLPDDPLLYLSTTKNMTVETVWKGTDLSGPMFLGWGQFMLQLVNGVPRVWRTDGVTTPMLSGTKYVADGRRHHIALEAHRDTGAGTYLLRLSIDGRVDAQMTTSWFYGTPSSWRIGHLWDPDLDERWLFGVTDEFVVYDHLLGPDRIRAHWHAATGGEILANSLDLALTLPPAHVFIAQWAAADPLDLGLTMGTHALRQPLRPAHINDTDSVQGPVVPLTPGALYPSPISGATEVPGIYVAPTPADAIPLRPASVASLTVVPGAWLPVPATNPEWPIPIPVPPSPTYPDGYLYVEGRMTVPGITSVVEANCAPTMNRPGGGSFTRKGPVTPNRTQVSFHVAGKTTMTGFVTSSRDIVVDGGEESTQLQTMNVDATAAELDDIIILPDFGSQDIGRIGLPTQDMRVFDWTANGVGDWSGDGALYTPGTTPVPQMMASGVDILAADEPLGGPWNSAFPLPDVWPDNNSQWINWISPRIPAPAGWALFYVATPKPPAGKVQFWLCAYDYAELWVDGVKTVVCDTPGKSEHVEIEMTSDHHLLAIRLYTRGGAAGVMSTMLPVNKSDQLYGPPTMNTRSGWTAIPVHDAFIYTPGAVLQRLFHEARERGNSLAKKWTLTFTNKLDSNGRPWPVPEWPIELDVGMSYLDALGVLAETYIDWTESPGGWKLNAFIKGQGTGRSAANAWTAGVNALSIVRDKAIRE